MGGRRQPPREPAWTVEEACAWFADGGVPIEADRLRLIIRALKWQPTGRTPSREQGGRGQALYPVSDLMQLHANLAPWLVAGYDGRPGNDATDT